jgi:alcohol dehydrogenase class IV
VSPSKNLSVTTPLISTLEHVHAIIRDVITRYKIWFSKFVSIVKLEITYLKTAVIIPAYKVKKHILSVLEAIGPEIAAIYQSYFPSDLAAYLTELLIAAQMPTRISHYGVTEADLLPLAEMAMKQWTAQFNPRSLNLDDFVQLYRAAL